MKIIKLVSIIVIIASVVALGAYAGKQMFRMLEEKSQASVSQTDVKTIQAAPDSSAPTAASSTAPANLVPTAVVSAQAPTAPPTSAASPARPLLGDEVAYALVKGVKVRFEPSLTSKEMMRVNQGTKGFVLEHQEGWTKIKWDFNKKIGWTRDDLLLIGPQEVLSTMVDHNGKLLSDQSVASATASAVASMTAARIQAATKKAQAIAQTVSSAVAKPAKPADTVKGYVAGGKLPEEGTINADPAAKIRAKPDTRAELVGKVPKGVAVKVLSAKQVGKYMWFNISYNNGRKEGWTREDNLQF